MQRNRLFVKAKKRRRFYAFLSIFSMSIFLAVVANANTTITWPDGTNITTNHTYYSNIYIGPGSMATISSGVTIKMGPGCKITIDNQAELFIYQATITGTNANWDTITNWWLGIEVLGGTGYQAPLAEVLDHTFPHDIDPPGIVYSGALQIHNSQISYSQAGIVMGAIAVNTHNNYVGVYPGNGGGLIMAVNSLSMDNFLNNYAQAIYFDDFRSSDPTRSNFSFITHCNFKFDCTYSTWGASQSFINAYNNPFVAPTKIPYGLSISGTYSFYGNTFSVTGHLYTGVWTGIYLYNCGYSIFGNNFNNLQNGLFIDNPVPGIFQQTIAYNTFYEDVYGIWTHDPDLINMVFNTFTDNVSGGIALNGGGSGQFIAEGNTFSDFTLGSLPFGIQADDMGSAGNLIHLNSFTNINEAIESEEDNSGLRFRCNTFSSCPDHDIYIPDGKAAQYQGSTINPAYNIFSDVCATNEFSNLDWDGLYPSQSIAATDQMQYYYYNTGNQDPSVGGSQPFCYTGGSVNIISVGGTDHRSTQCTSISTVFSNVTYLITTDNAFMSGLPTPPAGTNDQNNEYAGLELDNQLYTGLYAMAMQQEDTAAIDTVDATHIAVDSTNRARIKGIVDSTISVLKHARTSDTTAKFVATDKLVNIYISLKQYDSATRWVDTLYSMRTGTGDSDMNALTGFYNIYIDGEEDSFNSAWKSSNLSAINSIYYSHTPAFGKALSLLQWIDNMAVDRDTTDTLQIKTFIYPLHILTDTGYGPPPETSAPMPAHTNNISVYGYPDPVHDNLTLEINNPYPFGLTLTFEIENSLGKICNTKIINVSESGMVYDTEDFGSLPPGIYYVSLVGPDKIIYHSTFVKQ